MRATLGERRVSEARRERRGGKRWLGRWNPPGLWDVETVAFRCYVEMAPFITLEAVKSSLSVSTDR